MIEEKVANIAREIDSFQAKTEKELEEYRIRFISKKSVVGELFGELKNVPNEKKREMGQVLNQLKQQAQNKFQDLIDGIQEKSGDKDKAPFDMTLPPAGFATGSIHPLTYVRNEIIEIFERIGFNVADGPEIEDDWHNFTALNFPENHPAREMQDTFFIEKNPDMVLRTHTSGVQIRLMENKKPPIRSIMPGRVYRNEAVSARAHCVFHQVEGLYVNKNVSFVDLKQTLYHFAKEMFAKDTKVRFRPSYFPFTEPSAEIDISCQICQGDLPLEWESSVSPNSNFRSMTSVFTRKMIFVSSINSEHFISGINKDHSSRWRRYHGAGNHPDGCHGRIFIHPF